MIGRLPLFVLPMVLLPGALEPLHVFEPRYRRMMARCLEADRRFGILFHDSAVAGRFTVEEGMVGCVAEILAFRPLPDGRSLVLTRGAERFRVMDGIENGEEYFEALAEEHGDAGDGPDGSADRRRRVLDRFRGLLDRHAAAGGESPVELPDADGGDISFAIANLLSTGPTWRQVLLETDSETLRLELIERLLADATA